MPETGYEWDEAKRDRTLQERGLDFKDALKIFEAENQATLIDDRKDYGEERFISAAFIKGNLIVIVWTQRGNKKRIISMRYAHDKEKKCWKERMDR